LVKRLNIAVIGGGVFGALAAIRLAEAGRRVSLFERNRELFRGASTNANRLHLGYHYPRDEDTARQCMLGYDAFRAAFPEAVLEGVRNTYFIARHGSLVSPEQYLAFCDRLSLPYGLVDLAAYQPAIANVAMGIQTEETIYDAAVLSVLLERRLRELGVGIRCDSDIVDVVRNAGSFTLRTASDRYGGFDGVVNCAYADINRLTEGLGHEPASRQYEYTAVPVVEIEFPATASITVLDGPFVSLLPFGGGNRYLMYHVDHSVIARSDDILMDRAWLDAAASPFATVDQRLWFEKHVEACATFIPALLDARLTGIAQGPRMVLANREHDDGRPSFITEHRPGYVSVFAGKLDHSIWVADAVARTFA
jgi:glycine/D-amino acid oxidase-like deaminating enzyme